MSVGRPLLVASCLGLALLGCDDPVPTAPAERAAPAFDPASGPARGGDPASPASPRAETVDARCLAARGALERFVEALPTDCETDADCMTSHVRMSCEPITAHTRSAFTPPRIEQLRELRQHVRDACPEPRVVCGPAPFDHGACEAGTCRGTRSLD